MPPGAHIKITGMKQLRARIDELKRAHKNAPKGVRVGFFETAKYQDGTPVASVAAWNEFGIESRTFPVISSKGKVIFLKRAKPKKIPARPFFRNAAKDRFRKSAMAILRRDAEPTLVVDKQTANLIGLKLQADVQESIYELKDPPHAEVTKLIYERLRAAKNKGTTNPLISTGKMRMSVTYKLIKKKPGEASSALSITDPVAS